VCNERLNWEQDPYPTPWFEEEEGEDRILNNNIKRTYWIYSACYLTKFSLCTFLYNIGLIVLQYVIYGLHK
jgi:hypothetical protein